MSHKIGVIRLTALVTGNLVGASVFVLPATLAAFGSLSLVGWGITAIGAIILALIFANLSHSYSGTGGPYIYAREAFGYNVGFYVCWGYWAMSWISNAALLAGALGYLSNIVGHMDKETVMLAEISIIIAITAFNLLGIEVTGSGELFITIIKLLPLIFIPIAGVMLINYGNFSIFNASELSIPSALNSVVLLTLFSFIGLESGTVPGDQVVNPKKSIAIATIVGTLIAAIIYILGTVVIFGILPQATLVASKAPYADVANIIFGGKHWGCLFALAVIISCVGALNGWTMIVGRIPQTAVKDGMFPKVFGKVNRFGTPYMGIMISSALSIPFILMSVQENLKDQFNFVTEIAAILVLVIYLICVLAFLKLNSREYFNYTNSQIKQCKERGAMPINIGERRVDDAMVKNGNWYYTSSGAQHGKTLGAAETEFKNARWFYVGRMVLGIVGLVFVLWALWATSIKMALFSLVIFALGIPVHLWMQRSKVYS